MEEEQQSKEREMESINALTMLGQSKNMEEEQQSEEKEMESVVNALMILALWTQEVEAERKEEPPVKKRKIQERRESFGGAVDGEISEMDQS